MLNLLDLFKKSVKTSIEDKTLPFSISRFNVGQRIKDLADQTMRVPLLQVLPNVFYPLGFKGRDADFNEYIAIADNVNGDYNDSAKWKPSGGGGGGSSTFSALTDSPYDNTQLAAALNSKQDRLAGIVSGCVITVETFVGVDTNKRIRVTDGTWYIPTSEYTKAIDTVSAEITLCPTGGDFKYYDIVADNTGAIAIHEGTPSTSPAHYVIDPLTEVLLGFITVGDAVIEEPVITNTNSGLQQFSVSLIATTPLDIYTQAMQGVPVPQTILAVGESDVAMNGLYSWQAHWVRVPSSSFPFGGYNTEYELYSGSLFTALQGTEVNKGYVLNRFTGGYQFIAIGSGSSLTQSSQAQVEAAFDNTDQTTPVVLEQTSVLTPFNAWWLVQKVKAFFSTTANQTDSTNKRFVTDAEKVVIGNTSNTNSGDETTASIQSKRPLKTINTQSLEGSGDLTVTGFTAASVAEVNTGTDNTKGATPLNLETSKYLTQSGTKTYATTGGTSTAYTVTLSPAITAYATGSQFNLVAHTSNTTTTPTINFNGLGAKNIVDRFGNAIGVGDFQGNLIVRYNGTSFNIIGAVTTMAANTVKGNNTGSTASAVDLTTDQFTAMMEIAVAVGITGIITAMISATYKYIRLTSASATGLGSILAPSSSYKDLYIWNDTGVTLTLYHDYSSEATAANRILCGANRSWANNTMLHLKYDVTEARWCTVAHDGNTFRSLLAGTGTRLVEASSTGQEQAVLTTQDIDFSGAQQTSATSASWTGVNEVTISGLKQGQLYVDVWGGYRYECHVNDKCSRTPIINVAAITTNLIYPCLEVTSTSQLLVSDNAYVANNASQVVFTLPTTATQGDIIIINGKGAGGWEIAQNASQQIVGGATNTTVGTGGYITAGQYAAITLKCITGGASTIWQIVCINPATTLTIV